MSHDRGPTKSIDFEQLWTHIVDGIEGRTGAEGRHVVGAAAAPDADAGVATPLRRVEATPRRRRRTGRRQPRRVGRRGGGEIGAMAQ